MSEPVYLKDVETLAMLLHEAGKEAVERGNTVACQKFGDKSKKFIEWPELNEEAKEGRRIQARFLLDLLDIQIKNGPIQISDIPDLTDLTLAEDS